MVLPLRPPLLEVPQSLRLLSVLVTQVPWYVALARPVLDVMAFVTPLAPSLVVQLGHAEGHSGAIYCELALGAK